MREKEICHNMGSVSTIWLMYQHYNMCGFISHIMDVRYILVSQSILGHCIPPIMGTALPSPSYGYTNIMNPTFIDSTKS